MSGLAMVRKDVIPRLIVNPNLLDFRNCRSGNLSVLVGFVGQFLLVRDLVNSVVILPFASSNLSTISDRTIENSFADIAFMTT